MCPLAVPRGGQQRDRLPDIQLGPWGPIRVPTCRTARSIGRIDERGPHSRLRSEAPYRLRSRCVGSTFYRQGDRERRALPLLAAHSDLPPVGLDNPLGDREPKASPRHLAIRHAIEALEEMRQGLGRDTRTGVRDSNDDGVAAWGEGGGSG